MCSFDAGLYHRGKGQAKYLKFEKVSIVHMYNRLVRVNSRKFAWPLPRQPYGSRVEYGIILKYA